VLIKIFACEALLQHIQAFANQVVAF
jgi:hypothetical protein